MNFDLPIDWLAVVVAAFASFSLGGLWYSKSLFGNAWMQEKGYTEEQLNDGNVAKAMGLGFAIAIVHSILMEILFNSLNITAVVEAITFGLLVGMGLVGLTMYSDGLFNRDSTKLSMILIGYRCCYFIIMSLAIVLL